jgi:hypothetical protein
VFTFLGPEPTQAGRAVIKEFGSLTAHRFLHLSFADRAGHHAVPNDALMNVPPVVLFAHSLIHENVINLKRLKSTTYKGHACALRNPALSFTELEFSLFDENLTPQQAPQKYCFCV